MLKIINLLHMETKDIVNHLIVNSELNAKQFAESIGVTPTQIYDLQSGKIKKITGRMADKILSKYSKYSKSWLLTGEGSMWQDEINDESSVSTFSWDTNEHPIPLDDKIVARIEIVIENKALSNTEFAQKLHIPEEILNAAFDRDLQACLLVAASIIKVFKDISPRWLFTGMGEMFDYKVPILPREIYNEKNLDVFNYVKENPESVGYSAAIRQFAKYELVYEVPNDCMMPEFKLGDRLALSEVPAEAPIINGAPYVVDTKSLGLIFRLLYGQEDYFLCRSFDDDRYAPFTIDREDIYNIYRVVGLVRTNM